MDAFFKAFVQGGELHSSSAFEHVRSNTSFRGHKALLPGLYTRPLVLMPHCIHTSAPPLSAGRLISLPLLLESYTPDLARLPDFILALARDVEWGCEEDCFHTLACVLADFYAVQAPVLVQEGEGAEVEDAQAHRQEDGQPQAADGGVLLPDGLPQLHGMPMPAAAVGQQLPEAERIQASMHLNVQEAAATPHRCKPTPAGIGMGPAGAEGRAHVRHQQGANQPATGGDDGITIGGTGQGRGNPLHSANVVLEEHEWTVKHVS